jgi:hypothetical protein
MLLPNISLQACFRRQLTSLFDRYDRAGTASISYNLKYRTDLGFLMKRPYVNSPQALHNP